MSEQPTTGAAGTNRAEIDRWHATRMRRLRADDGWLTLVGLHWLAPGPNTVGRGARAVAYDGFPAEDLGVLTVSGTSVRFDVAPGAPVESVPADGVLATDADGEPTVLHAGTCRMHVIVRGGRPAVRVRDAAAPLRRGMPDIERFPVDEQWRIVAAFAPAAAGETIPVTLLTGSTADEPIAGRAEFERDGATQRIILMPGADDGRYFVVFGDATNGDTTYGGGRFLEAVRDGSTVVLDFNRAYNPPCSFTPWATCPLPPDDNRLPFAVPAGERRPAVPGH